MVVRLVYLTVLVSQFCSFTTHMQLHSSKTAPLPPPRPKCNFNHPKQLSPFTERLKLPFSIDEILSGYEDIVSSGTDQFTTWVKTDPDATLVRHMVDVQEGVAEFREVCVSFSVILI